MKPIIEFFEFEDEIVKSIDIDGNKFIFSELNYVTALYIYREHCDEALFRYSKDVIKREFPKETRIEITLYLNNKIKFIDYLTNYRYYNRLDGPASINYNKSGLIESEKYFIYNKEYEDSIEFESLKDYNAYLNTIILN